MTKAESHLADAAIRGARGRAGAATTAALELFATDGSPIRRGAPKLTSMGRPFKVHQTPDGVATAERHVPRGAATGKTYRPLDQDARIGVSSTPQLAERLASKGAEFGSTRATLDLEGNHGRTVALSQHSALTLVNW